MSEKVTLMSCKHTHWNALAPSHKVAIQLCDKKMTDFNFKNYGLKIAKIERNEVSLLMNFAVITRK